MSIGPDIKELHEENGIPFTIKHNGQVTVSGEYLDYELNSQVTKPFIREYFMEVTLSYDTQALAGDVILFDDGTGRSFMIMNKTAEIFEGEVISYDCVLYKTNIVALIYRASGEVRDPQTLEVSTAWQLHTSGEALLVEKMFGAELDSDSDAGQFSIIGNECYAPSHLDVNVMDRLIVSGEYAGGPLVSGEMYKVETVKKRDYDNVWVVGLAEDTRE